MPTRIEPKGGRKRKPSWMAWRHRLRSLAATSHHDLDLDLDADSDRLERNEARVVKKNQKRKRKRAIPVPRLISILVRDIVKAAFTTPPRPIHTTETTHELSFDRFESDEQAAYKPPDSVAITYANEWNPSEEVKRRAQHMMKTTAVFQFVSARPPVQSAKAEATDVHQDAHEADPGDAIAARSDAIDDLRRVDAYDWAPLPSTSSGTTSALSSPRQRQASTLPAYHCQLDPLDSFETFVLSLSLKTVRRYPQPTFWETAGSGTPGSSSTSTSPTISSSPQPASPRSRIFERRVATGCDRVMRTWFAPPTPSPTVRSVTSSRHDKDKSAIDQQDGSSATRAAQESDDRRLGSFEVLAATFGVSLEASLPRSSAETIRASVALPPVRTLEIDGASCSIQIQPHANIDSILCSHPILRASAGWSSPSPSSSPVAGSSGSPTHQSSDADRSRAWMFTSPFAYHPTTPSSAAGGGGGGLASASGADVGSRVELNFHCTEVRVSAARLLAMLHRLEDDVLEAEAQERRLYERSLERQRRWAGEQPSPQQQEQESTGQSHLALAASSHPVRNNVTIWTMTPGRNGGAGQVTHQLML